MERPSSPPDKPVIIVGAGVSGLLLAQYLRKSGVPFHIFERDAGLTTRGIGWGLTLHWSLPALRSLLPEELIRRLPEAYVDRDAVELGLVSTFPFFDLSSGKLMASTPTAPESQRIRVARDRFRGLLATNIEVKWGKGANGFESTDETVVVHFEDGTSCEGSLLVACDGGNSRIRRILHPQLDRYRIPVRLLGVRIDVAPANVEPLRRLDPFFLQGASSKDNTFGYFSMLDAPGNRLNETGQYSCQIVVSWPVRDGFLGRTSAIESPATNEEKLDLLRTLTETWIPPFRTLVESIPATADIKAMDLHDFAPPRGLQGAGRVVLVGDSFHEMAMYRGEGANHAIVDVADLAELVVSAHLLSQDSPFSDLRAALNAYEDRVVDRARPGVLASRHACLDAHEWSRITDRSPLLTRRLMKVDFDESSLSG